MEFFINGNEGFILLSGTTEEGYEIAQVVSRIQSLFELTNPKSLEIVENGKILLRLWIGQTEASQFTRISGTGIMLGHKLAMLERTKETLKK